MSTQSKKVDPDRDQQYLPVSAAWFGLEEKKEVLATLDSGWITTGPRTRALEQAFAVFVGTREAVAVNSCTAALHLSLAALGIGDGDVVITTPFTFAATANVVVHQRAFPAFVDIDPNSYNLDANRLQSFLQCECTWDKSERRLLLRSNGKRVRAIIPVHYGGQPCDMDAINALAQQFDLAVIEDAAHAVGARYRGRNAGTLGSVGCFSFYANKNMTTAEGGMLTTDDTALANRVRVLSLHGMNKDAWKRYTAAGSWQYDVIEPGFKYNLPDIAAALGLHQLKRLAGFLQRRAELAALYDAALSGVGELKLPAVAADVNSAWHLYPVQIVSNAISRGEVIEALRQRNIGTSVHFIPLHLMSFYQRSFGYRRGDFPVAEQVFKRILSLPLFPRMEDSDVTRVASDLLAIVQGARLAHAS